MTDLYRRFKSWWRRNQCPYHRFQFIDTYEVTEWQRGWLMPPTTGPTKEVEYRIRKGKVRCVNCGLTEIHTITDYRPCQTHSDSN